MAQPTITATVAGAASNSYVTLAEADEYMAGRLHASAWETAATNDKEKALISACRAIEGLQLAVRRPRYGYPSDPWNLLDTQSDPLFVSDPAQALSFPRCRDVDSAGAYAIPEPAKRAQCEEALALLAFGAEAQRRAALQASGVSGFQVDGLSESYREGAGSSPLASADARRLMLPFLRMGGVIATSDLPEGEFSPGSAT